MTVNRRLPLTFEGSFDPAAILQVPQRRHRADLDRKPTKREIVAAIKKMNRWRSGGEAQIPAEYYKAILTVAEDTKSTREWNALMRGIMAIFDEVWTSGSYPGEADIPEPVHIRTTAEAIGHRNSGPLFKPDEEESGESEGRYAAYKSATNYNQFIALRSIFLNGRYVKGPQR